MAVAGPRGLPPDQHLHRGSVRGAGSLPAQGALSEGTRRRERVQPHAELDGPRFLRDGLGSRATRAGQQAGTTVPRLGAMRSNTGGRAKSRELRCWDTRVPRASATGVVAPSSGDPSGAPTQKASWVRRWGTSRRARRAEPSRRTRRATAASGWTRTRIRDPALRAEPDRQVARPPRGRDARMRRHAGARDRGGLAPPPRGRARRGGTVPSLPRTDIHRGQAPAQSGAGE